jgi:hypothetical protein
MGAQFIAIALAYLQSAVVVVLRHGVGIDNLITSMPSFDPAIGLIVRDLRKIRSLCEALRPRFLFRLMDTFDYCYGFIPFGRYWSTSAK